MKNVNDLNLEYLQKAKLAAKKVVLSTVLASSILSAAGCSNKPAVEPQRVESTDENLDNEGLNGKVYTDEEINNIIELAYREGYAQGYYEAGMLERINQIAHEDGQLYIGITGEDGEMQYTGINNLLCVCEDETNYYVLKATPETLPYSEGMINYLDGKQIDHNFDIDNVKYVDFEAYVNEYYGEERLKECREAYEANSTDAFSKYDCSDFKQLELYNTLCGSKTR